MELTQDRLSVMIQTMPGIFEIYRLRQGKLETLYSSEGDAEICGMTAEEYAAATEGDAVRVVLESDRPAVAAALEEALQGSREIGLTFRRIHKTLELVWVYAKVRCVGTSEGCPVLLALFQNHTREMQAQDFLISHVPLGIYVIDRSSYELLYVNEQTLKKCGNKSYVGTECYRYFNGLEQPCAWCPLKKIENGYAHVEENYVPQRDRWYSHDVWEMDWYGRRAAAFNMVDIMQQKKRQQNLELDNQQIDAILGNVPGGVAIFSDRAGAIRLEYANDGFYSSHHGSRAYWQAQSANPLDWALAEDHRIFEDEFRMVRGGKKAQGSATYRVRGEDGEIHWINNQFRRAREQDGVSFYCSSLACIDDQKEIELENNRRRLLEAAVAETGISVFAYDPHRHTITTLDDRSAKVVTDCGLGAGIENVPEALAPTVEAVSLPELFAMYRALDRGEKAASCDIWLKPAEGKKACCQHLSYFSLFDEAGQPFCAYGTAQNITAQKRSEQKYDWIYRETVRANPDSLGTFRLNLTKNTCSDGQSPYASVLSQQKDGTVDGYLAANAAIIVDETIRENYLAQFSREKLLEMFRLGKTELSTEYPVLSSRGSVIWINGFMNMAQNPTTGEIEAITYALDVTRRKTMENIISRITKAAYDHIALIDPAAGTFELQKLEWTHEGFHPNARSDFDALVRQAIDQYVYPADRALMEEHCRLDRLTEHLRKFDTETVFYRYQEPGGALQYKQIHYCWLDSSKTLILEYQTDVSKLCEAEQEEQEEQRRQQEALVMAEHTQTLEETISGIPAGLAVYRQVGRETRIVMVNDRLCELAGVSKEIILSQELDNQITRRVHPEDMTAVRRWMKLLFTKAGGVSFEYRTQIGKRKQYRWLRAEGRAVPAKDGPKIAYVLYYDATEQKQTEAEFDCRISELLATAPNALRAARLNLTKNTFLQGQTGVPEEQFILQARTADEYFKRCNTTVYSEKERGSCWESISRAKLLESFNNGKNSLTFRFRRFDRAQNQIRWTTSYYNLVRNPRTGDVEAVIYTLDTDEAVRSSEIMARITSADYEYMALLDVKKRTIQFLEMQAEDRAATPTKTNRYDEYVQYTFEQMYGTEGSRAHVEALSLDRVLRELKREQYYVYSFVLRDADGLLQKKQLKYSWLDEMKDTILLTRTDISAAYRQEMEQLHRMTQALEEARQANAAKTEFLSRISHDIRTPISIITSMTGFAKEDLGNVEKLRGDLARIEIANGMLLSLINDVLDISKIDSGKVELHPEPYSAEEFSANLRTIGEPLCARKGLKLQVDTKGLAGGAIRVDKTRLNQIALNLLSNAVKYTPAGGTVLFRCFNTIRPDGRAEGGFTVRDTGIGMSQTFQKEMFEPFTQEYTNPYRDKTQPGTGLGLSIVKRLADLMGGTISVTSELGRGTEITVHLVTPQEEIFPARESAAARGTLVKYLQPLSGKVLLAEDNPINTEIALRILGSFGLEADHAENGQAAVGRFAASAPGEYRAVLMDIQMPVMDGYEAAKAIRGLPRPDAGTIPIIAMTADAFAEAMERSRRAGMDGYMTKPLDPERLYACLEQGQKRLPEKNPFPSQ